MQKKMYHRLGEATNIEMEEHVLQLAKLCKRSYASSENIGPLGGRSGLAIFQFYCAKYFDNDEFSDTGSEMLSSCVDSINNGYTHPTYSTGIAGFGWTLCHLVENDFIDLNLDQLLNPFDEYLFSQMKFELDEQNIDLLHGAMGYGFYFFKRYQTTTDVNCKQQYLIYLRYLIDAIKKLAIIDEENIKWNVELNPPHGKRVVNLGLSHGMSSIIYLLSKLSSIRELSNKTIPLVKGAANYILTTNGNAEGTSLFPKWINPNEPIQYNSRIAWCYGDIGIGLALNWAGELTKQPHLCQKSQEILLHSSKRVEPHDTLVIDSGICHGSFGNMKIFENLWKIHKKEQFKKASEFWLKDGLNRHTGEHQEPYRQFYYATNSWEFTLSLLQGVSGIGLSLIDYISDGNNNWDECLFLR